MKARARLVAWLLHLANAHPPHRRAQFYALKDRLCRRYGAFLGHDVQYITDRCWGWPSSDSGCEGAACTKCDGTGIYRQSWTWLERWEIGGRVFHRPVGTRPAAMSTPLTTIYGRIEHREVSVRAAREATLLLALIFDRALFWPLFTHGAMCYPAAYPLLRLNKLVFGVRMWLGYWRSRTCPYCERRFRPGFRRRAVFMCRPCLDRPAPAPMPHEEVPF